MIDSYVDYTSYTRPALYNEQFYNSVGRNVEGFAWLIPKGDTNAHEKWVALYDSSACTVIFAHDNKFGALVAQVVDTERHSQNLVSLKQALEYIYCNDEASFFDASKSRVALRGVIDSVEDLADDREYLALDKLLSLLEPNRLRPVTAVAFLRSSYAVKARLRNWNGLYQVVYAYLTDIGENPKRLMRGLSLPRVEGYA